MKILFFEKYLFIYLEKLEEKINNDIFLIWSWFERNYGICVLKVVKKLSILIYILEYVYILFFNCIKY